jgi:hypothetical protein
MEAVVDIGDLLMRGAGVWVWRLICVAWDALDVGKAGCLQERADRDPLRGSRGGCSALNAAMKLARNGRRGRRVCVERGRRLVPAGDAIDGRTRDALGLEGRLHAA